VLQKEKQGKERKKNSCQAQHRPTRKRPRRCELGGQACLPSPIFFIKGK